MVSILVMECLVGVASGMVNYYIYLIRGIISELVKYTLLFIIHALIPFIT